MKTPQYQLEDNYTVYQWPKDPFILLKGAAIHPISEQWVPRHITDSTEERYQTYGADGKFCYTNVGMVFIPTKLIRRVD